MRAFHDLVIPARSSKDQNDHIFLQNSYKAFALSLSLSLSLSQSPVTEQFMGLLQSYGSAFLSFPDIHY